MTSGTIGVTGAGGVIVPDSGAQSMSISGTFAQITADLANLSYTAAGTAGSDTISINTWDQAGLDSNVSINVFVTPVPPAPVVIAASPLITASNATITATAGNHTTFAGNGDAISALGGTETAMVFEGSDPITWQQAGYGNDEIHRYVLRSPDLFDTWPSPAGPDWSGSAATAHDFANPMVSLVVVTPGNTATFHDLGSLSLVTPLAHVVTEIGSGLVGEAVDGWPRDKAGRPWETYGAYSASADRRGSSTRFLEPASNWWRKGSRPSVRRRICCMDRGCVARTPKPRLRSSDADEDSRHPSSSVSVRVRV